MQGKGLVKVLLIAVALVSVFQLCYFIPTGRVETAADNYAEVASANSLDADKKASYGIARARYLDSISSDVVFSIPLVKDYTYSELKSRQLALGLDLKGGMSAVLQVNLEELLTTLAGTNNKDETFLRALAAANERLKNSQSNFVTLFVEEYQKLGEGKKLARLFFRSELLEGINADSSDGEVERILRDKADETVGLTFTMLKERIDKLGVAQPNISLDAGRDLILVELPGIENPKRAEEFLQASAQLEFWDVYRYTDPGIMNAFQQADARLAASLRVESNETRKDSVEQIVGDSISGFDTVMQVVDVPVDPFSQGGPLLSKLALNQGQRGNPVMGLADRNQTTVISEMLNDPTVKNLFPANSKFLWTRAEAQDYNTGDPLGKYELYLIKMQPGSEKAPLEGDVVTKAAYQPDPETNQPAVSLSMDKRGAKKWAEMTTRAAQQGNREIGIVLDNEVVSAPGVRGPITGGRSSIDGNYTVQEANDFASILEVGKLPAKTQIIQKTTVGPSLGADNIKSSFTAMAIGFGLLLLFMILYYGGAGIVSIIALIVNLIFIFGALSSIGTVLTLPGIAGVVLTIGMAVDANVIIFERVREELRAGKTLLSSIADGFKNSYSAIIDANVTTLLSSFVLAYFGLGPIKGFAVVLIIGVISSLLTAVLFGKLMIDGYTSKDRNLTFWTGASKNAFANLKIDWIGKRKIAYVISGVLITAGIISMATNGFDLGVELKGGYSYNVQFADDQLTNDQVGTGLAEFFEGSAPLVKSVSTANTFQIVTDYKIEEQGQEAADEVTAALYNGVKQLTGGSYTLEQFSDAEATGIPHITASSKVGPTIADDIKKSSYQAGIIALLLIFFYIFIRFNKWQYSLGAVAALFHDSLIVLGIFSLCWKFMPFTLEIDQAFIAAILTVIGYSINDTVVVFDRIREFLGIYTNKSKDEVINMAINSTFSRTVITSFTTLLVVGILFLFGGGSIKGFAFAILIGVLVGTYSSIFVATPIVRDFSGELKAKKTVDTKKNFTRAASKA